MRIKRAVNAQKKRRTTLKEAKGYRGQASRSYRVATEAVMKAGQYAYVGRKLKKRDFRSLWITRINAACRQNDISYSRFISGLKQIDSTLDRKVLSQIAIESPETFAALVKQVKEVK